MSVNLSSDLLKARDTHSNRPAATAVAVGALYSCSTHNLVYRSDGASWSTWAAILPPGGTTGQVPAKNSSTDYDISWATVSGGGSGLALLGETKLQHASVDTQVTTTGTVQSKLTSSLDTAITVPASGTVYVDCYSLLSQGTSGTIYWGVWDVTAGAVVAASEQYMMTAAEVSAMRMHNRWKITGLTTGARTLSLSVRCTNATNFSMYHGPTWGAILFQLWG